MSVAETRDFLRDALRNYLEGTDSSPDGLNVLNFFNQGMGSTIRHNKLAPDRDALLEYWGELQRVGAICVVGAPVDTLPDGRFPTFVVTAWGRRLLNDAELTPSRRERYFDDLAKRVGTPDPIAMIYLQEAVACWASGVPRSSAVMLGCACERLVRMLADAVRSAGIVPWAKNLEDHEKRVSAGKVPPMAISEVFKQVRSALLEGANLSNDLVETVDRQLSAIFEHTRRLRNRSGHPTGDEVRVEEAHAGLLLFPVFHETVTRLIAAVEKASGAAPQGLAAQP